MIPFAVLGYAHDQEDIQVMIDAATELSEHQIRKGYAPPIWSSRARYKREQHKTLPGVERVQLPEETHAMGAGDCDDLAPWAAASMRIEGIPARALVIRSPGIGYHVLVRFRDPRDGKVKTYDPSAERGMYNVEGRLGRGHFARLARSALKRGMELAAKAEKMSPGSVARRALLAEASRLLKLGEQSSEKAESMSATETEGES